MGGVTASLCNSTINQLSAYMGRVFVYDIESDGSEGAFRLGPTYSSFFDAKNFTMATGCALPGELVYLYTL